MDVVKLMRDPALTSTVVLTQGGAVTFVGALLPRRPAGLITIEGAPESHLGIVCREFNIPAIMSAKLTGSIDVEHVDGSGLVTTRYVQRIVETLDGRLVQLDCADAETGCVYIVPSDNGVPSPDLQ
jgi:signal transduction protein with GAF and PtsI domain